MHITASGRHARAYMYVHRAKRVNGTWPWLWPRPKALGVPSLGVPSLGVLSLGDPSLGVPSLGVPSLGVPSLGVPSLGDPSLGDPSLGDPSLWPCPSPLPRPPSPKSIVIQGLNFHCSQILK